MVRTIISLTENEKHWVDSYSRSRHISLAETVRIAIKKLREENNQSASSILDKTSGIWKRKKTDSESLVEKLRNEWDER